MICTRTFLRTQMSEGFGLQKMMVYKTVKRRYRQQEKQQGAITDQPRFLFITSLFTLSNLLPYLRTI